MNQFEDFLSLQGCNTINAQSPHYPVSIAQTSPLQMLPNDFLDPVLTPNRINYAAQSTPSMLTQAPNRPSFEAPPSLDPNIKTRHTRYSSLDSAKSLPQQLLHPYPRPSRLQGILDSPTDLSTNQNSPLWTCHSREISNDSLDLLPTTNNPPDPILDPSFPALDLDYYLGLSDKDIVSSTQSQQDAEESHANLVSDLWDPLQHTIDGIENPYAAFPTFDASSILHGPSENQMPGPICGNTDNIVNQAAEERDPVPGTNPEGTCSKPPPKRKCDDLDSAEDPVPVQ